MTSRQCSRLLLLISTMIVVSKGLFWMTSSSDAWSYECPTNQSFKNFTSMYYSNYYRVWNFTCEPFKNFITLTDCEWSGYKNDYRGLLHFQCPNDGIMTGIASEFDDDKADRTFTFKCCSPEMYAIHSCVYTLMSEPFAILNYRVPDGWFLRGLTSTWVGRGSYERDRGFYFNICRVGRVDRSSECE